MERGYSLPSSSRFTPDYSVFPPLMSTQAFEASSPQVGYMEYFNQSPPTVFDPDYYVKIPKPEPIESDQHLGFFDDLQSSQKYLNLNIPITAKTKRVHEPSSSKNGKTTSSLPSSSVANQARKRRKTISENIRALERLMPWETKMNIATMLTEAYKYIKFLQAQVNVLQSMPYHSLVEPTIPSASISGNNVLEKLNRQQLLQVLVNSPAAQTTMSSQGNCVYSVEQLLMFNKKLVEQMKKSSDSPY